MLCYKICRLIAVLAALILGLNGFGEAQAGYITSIDLLPSAVTPVDFQNSTILSVAVSPTGEVVASKGINIATVPFDGLESTSTPLTFTTNHLTTTHLRYNPSGILHLLTLNFNGPGHVLRVENGTFTTVVNFGPAQGFSRDIAFDALGGFLVSGTYGNIDHPGWLRRYTPDGSLVFAIDVSVSPSGLAFDSAGGAYLGTFDGKVFSVSPTGKITQVAALSSEWVGHGVGYVESFAITPDDKYLFGVNLGQRFGQNSSAIIRVASTSQTNVLAFGVGVLSPDMTFGPEGDLFVASYGNNGNSAVYRFSGSFDGNIGGNPPSPIAVPEPSSLLLLAFGSASLFGYFGDRDRGEPRGSSPPTPPGVRSSYQAVRWLTFAAWPGVKADPGP